MTKCEVCFVSMPFSDVTMPSMALSLLKPRLTEIGVDSVILYEYMNYARRIGTGVYRGIELFRSDVLMGEIIFAKAAHGKTLRPLEEYYNWMVNYRIPVIYANGKLGLSLDDFNRLQEDAEKFVDEAAERILSCQPKIVALVSMFQQTNANIALARRLKRAENPPLILIGGANCMGDLGAALIEYVEAFDYAFIGEADEIFAEVCAKLLKDKFIAPENLPYGVLSRQSPPPKVPVHRVTKDITALPAPDFDEFFQTHERNFPGDKLMSILIEGSRGCWWGRHKPCTFCGLNGPARNYREKSTAELADEMEFLLKKYPQAHSCIFTDSILSQRQMKELPAEISRRKIKTRIFSEIKSNLTEADVYALAQAGFKQLQPGIESLQDDILRLMNKGCRAIKQIETLKSCRTHQIAVAWNLLAGFPDEKEEYYAELAEIIPKVMHFAAPNQFVHIVYQRYGEYTENPARYGLSIRPAYSYDFVFADREFINRSAYIFEPTDEEKLKIYWDIGRKGPAWRAVHKLVEQWLEERKKPPQRLDMYDSPDGITIYDMRKIARHLVYHLDGLRAELYRACRAVASRNSLLQKFSAEYDAQKILDELNWLCGENLMVNIKDEYLALAVDTNPQKFWAEVNSHE